MASQVVLAAAANLELEKKRFNTFLCKSMAAQVRLIILHESKLSARLYIRKIYISLLNALINLTIHFNEHSKVFSGIQCHDKLHLPLPTGHKVIG